MYEGQLIKSSQRCGTVSVSQESSQWHLVKMEPFGFGLNSRHCNQAVCACLLARLCVTKSWRVLQPTARGGGIALQVNKSSLKLHRLAPLSLAVLRAQSEYIKYLPLGSAGKGRSNPPITGQPISPWVAECYVSWRYLLKKTNGFIRVCHCKSEFIHVEQYLAARLHPAEELICTISLWKYERRFRHC